MPRLLLRRATKCLFVWAAFAGVGACYFTTDFSGLASTTILLVPEGGDGPHGVDGALPGADADAAAGVEAGGLVCPPGSFCDDFERSTPLGPWDRYGALSGGTVELTTHPMSGNRALRVSMTTEAQSAARLIKEVRGAKTLRYAYSLFVAAATRDVNIAPIQLVYGTRTVNLFVLAGSGGKVRFAEQEFTPAGESAFAESGLLTTVIGGWVDVVVQLDITSTVATCTVTYGGKLLRAGPLTREYGPTGGTVAIGTSFAQAGAAVAMDFDDVVLSVTAQ